MAIRSGTWEAVINSYKFAPASSRKRQWSAILGRILVGYLDDHAAEFNDVDLIVPSPTFVEPGGRREWDHIRELVEVADREQTKGPDPWPFDLADPPAIIKTADTPTMRGLTYQLRKANAEGPLREALEVPDPARTWRKWIVVVDDVFTGGLTLREVARALRLHGGARRVTGLTLARQPHGR